MSTGSLATVSAGTPSTAELLDVVGPAMQRELGRSIARLERLPYPYATSFAIEELALTFDDGSFAALLFKNLSPAAVLPEARRTRPGFVYDAFREAEVYRTLLSPAGLGTPRLFEATVDPQGGRCWLFLEKVGGVELYQVEELEVWKEAAGWLNRFHDRFAAGRHAVPNRLIRYDAAWYRRWMSRALAFASPASRDAVQRLAPAHERAVEYLCHLPATVIHGDFYASNVLAARNAGGWRIAPVDWERTAVGPGVLDLATLAMGWGEDATRELAQAYAGRAAGELLTALRFCRLHLCVQWLGWSPDWSPPEDHRQDWLGIALALAESFGR